MRLLNTRKLELETFPTRDGYTPPYAILSHCWSSNADDEVLYADICNGTATNKRAYSKLAAAMQQAREWKEMSYDWIWCDTCCINRESSAELTEAINSMYKWYAESKVCFAYIEDHAYESPTKFSQSKWFTRGWTLQELIAPKELWFFDKNWKRVGNKSFPANRDMVSKRTGISSDILASPEGLRSISIAQRMSWAALRRTTRPEDRAYCLMGIFQVNMPMLYGEGELNAFHRLQEQIMKDSNDHSIFAWTRTIKDDIKLANHHGLLADSPEDFLDSSHIVGYASWEDDQPFQPSNRGLRIDLHLTPAGDGTFYAALNCPIPHPTRGYYGFTAIMLRKLSSGVKQYARIRCHEIFALDTRSSQPTTVYVRQKAIVEDPQAIMPYHFFQPRHLYASPESYELLSVSHFPLGADARHFVPRPIHNPWLAAAQASAFQVIRRSQRLSAVLYFRRTTDHEQLAILLGSIEDLQVGFAIAVGEEIHPIASLEQTMILQPFGEEVEAGSHRVCVKVTVEIDTPRKLYILDISVDRRPVNTLEFRPAIVSPQDIVQGITGGIAGGFGIAGEFAGELAANISERAAEPSYRPMSLVRRARSRGPQ